MSATKTPVIDDSSFTGAYKGLTVPVRRLADGAFGLRITNLDRTDPPDYTPGGVPRSVKFNANTWALSADPKMPEIDVVCEASGFVPDATTPIYWRLQTLHVLTRFMRKGPKGHYVSRVVPLSGEWTGRSTGPQFSLFAPGAPGPKLVYDNNDDRVAGGHAILTIAARPTPTGPWLQDFVHLRISGQNMTTALIRSEVARIVANRAAPPFEDMLNAIFAWEAKSRQFSAARQTQATYKGVLFDWPDDPPGFPVAAFDFGVGISQFTDPGHLLTCIGWDWRANLAAGANVFFEKLSATYSPGIAWDQWALAAWAAYNGSGSDAQTYAQRLSQSPDGKKVPSGKVPAKFDLGRATKAIDFAPVPPGKWPIGPATVLQFVSSGLHAETHKDSARALGLAASRVAGDRRTLAWIWPQVARNLHAQVDRAATHVLPGLTGADVSAMTSGLGKAGIERLADASFAVAWDHLADPQLEATGSWPTGSSIQAEWNKLSDFVRKHVGEGRISDWTIVRKMMLEEFGAPSDVDLAIQRINAYYDQFVDVEFVAGGTSIRLHPAMKTRSDNMRALLTNKGAAAALAVPSSIGGFDIRLNANNANALSNHSFGIALDLDPALNPNLPLKTPANERQNWRDLVAFLTGVDPYGDESKRLQSPRTYDASLPDVTALRNASAAFVEANSSETSFATAFASAFQKAFSITIAASDVGKLLSAAAPPNPSVPAVTAILQSVGLTGSRLQRMAARTVYAQRVHVTSRAKGLKPAVIGTAATTARYGFVNLPAELIAGLVANDGASLRWLGSANSTKDYMHFDIRDDEHPPLY